MSSYSLISNKRTIQHFQVVLLTNIFKIHLLELTSKKKKIFNSLKKRYYNFGSGKLQVNFKKKKLIFLYIKYINFYLFRIIDSKIDSIAAML